MANRIQCLLLVEPEAQLNSQKDVNSTMASQSNAGTSTPSFTPKAYALLPSGLDTHPFCKILARNGIMHIVSSSTTPFEDARLEVIEIHVSSLPDSEKNSDSDSEFLRDEPQKLLYIYHTSLNDKFVRRLFSKSREIGFKECVRLDPSEAESATSEGSLKPIEDWLVSKVDICFRLAGGETLLHFAAKNGLSDLLKFLLKHNADVEARMNDGSTPLLKATGAGLFETVSTLVQAGANVNAQTEGGTTSLHLAAKNGRPDLLKFLLDRAANVDVRLIDGSTPLHKATSTGLLESVRTLVQAGANVNAKTADGTTPLHIAAGLSTKLAPLVEYLIRECGADVHAKNSQNATPIHYSVKSSPEILRILVANGADINSESSRGTVLYFAVFGGWAQTIEYVLSRRPDTQNKGNQEAFNLALSREDEKFDGPVRQMVAQGFAISVGAEDARIPSMLYGGIQKHLVEVARTLLKLGADVNQWRAFGGPGPILSPLFVAVRSKHRDMVQLLLDHGADVSATRNSYFNDIPRTPLSYAIEYSTPEIVKMLMAANPVNRHDPRLLEIAVMRAGLQTLKLLLEDGFDPNIRNFKGESLMTEAFRRSNVAIIRALVDYGLRCELSDLINAEIRDKNLSKAFLDFCFTDISRAGERTVRKLFDVKNPCAEKKVFYTSGSANVLARFLVKMMAANVCASAADLVPPHLFAEYRLAAFTDECKAEIESLKLERVGSTKVLLYDILTKQSHQTVWDESVASALDSSVLKSSYPCYGSVLCGKIALWKSQRMLRERSINGFRYLLKCARLPRLPDNVIKMIVDFLRNKDLFVLRKYFLS